MFNIVLAVSVSGIIVYFGCIYLKAREEAKREGYIYDDKNINEDR